jgi:hypothetical protein
VEVYSCAFLLSRYFFTVDISMSASWLVSRFNKYVGVRDLYSPSCCLSNKRSTHLRIVCSKSSPASTPEVLISYTQLNANKVSCISPHSSDEAKIKHLHVILHKQTGEPYGGFCTVGLIYYWKKQLCLEKKSEKQFNKSSLLFRWAHSLSWHNVRVPKFWKSSWLN